MRERKVQLRWINPAGEVRSRGIWVRDISAFVRRNQPAGAHSFEWRDFGHRKVWREVK